MSVSLPLCNGNGCRREEALAGPERAPQDASLPAPHWERGVTLHMEGMHCSWGVSGICSAGEGGKRDPLLEPQTVALDPRTAPAPTDQVPSLFIALQEDGPQIVSLGWDPHFLRGPGGAAVAGTGSRGTPCDLPAGASTFLG